MKKQYNILFLEDHSERYELDPVFLEEQKAEFRIISSLAEGMSLLDQAHQVIDAIMIGYQFDNIAVSGVAEFINLAKSKYPSILIYLISAVQEKEDVNAIIDLIQAGADDYLGNSNMNASFYLQQIIRHIDRNKFRYRVMQKYMDGINDDNLPLLLMMPEGSDCRAVFAYRLVSVQKPLDDSEAALSALINESFIWHQNFFRLLLMSLDDNLELTMKYISDPLLHPDEILIYLLFKVVKGNEEEVQYEFRQVQHDMGYYLFSRPEIRLFPYNFRPVTDKNEIAGISGGTPGGKHYFVRRAENNGDASQSGYVRPGFGVQQAVKQMLFPLLNEGYIVDSVNELCQTMMWQPFKTEVDIDMTLHALSLEELEQIKKMMTNPASQLHAQYFNFLIQSPDKLLRVEVSLTTAGDYENKGLKSAVSKAFFGDINYVDVKNQEEYSSFSDAHKGSENMLYVYCLPHLAEVARFPLPSKRHFFGIDSCHQNYFFLPPEMPHQGLVIGEKKMIQKTEDIMMQLNDLKLHTYILGQTGTGKSTLLYTMINAIINDGSCGLALVDPHGDLYERLKNELPEDKLKNVISFDPADKNCSIKINFLEYDRNYPEHQTLLINQIIDIFDNLYDMKTTGGPIFFKYMTAALLLATHHRKNIFDVVRIFQDEQYRDDLLERCSDEKIKNSWDEISRTGGEISFNNVSPYITSKLAEFENNIYLNRLMNTDESNISFRKIMDEGKILLIKLSKGKIADRGLRVMGSLLFNSLMMAAFSRDDTEQQNRKQFVLFVDEFQNFSTTGLLSGFSEARKYNLSLVVANQSLGQLDYTAISHVLGNVGNLAFFRLGMNDAQMLRLYFEPYFTLADMTALPNYTCMGRFNYKAFPARPFVFQTIP